MQRLLRALLPVLILLFCAATFLFAQSPESPGNATVTDPNTAALLAVMKQYFAEEKSEALLFILMGLGAAAIGIFMARRNDFGKGLLYPLAMIALIQLAVGGSVYTRTDAQAAALSEQLQTNPAAYAAEELPRMETVNFWFDVYKIIEIVLLCAGIGLLLYGRRAGSSLWQGVGVGLVAQSAVMLVLDFVAENRADIYTEAIRRFMG